MKKVLFPILALVLVTAMALPMAVAAHTEGDPAEYTLYAGQDIDVGTVYVWNDGTYLHVTYQTTGGWEMTETHLEVAIDLGDIPQTKKGNPIPGHFAYSADHNPPVTVWEEVINLNTAGFDVGDDLLIAAHAVVQKVNVIEAAPYYASTVISSEQGLTKGGGAVRWQRSDPDNALDYEAGQNEANFFSLGSGGWIIIEYDCPIPNGDGNDIQVIEDTWGTSYPLETADVFASQDGSTWFLLGQADNTNNVGIHTISEFDLDGILEWAKYIKVEDTTDPGPHNNSADGFDLNAVASLQDCVEIEEETAWGDGERFTERGNWATYFEYTVQGILTGTWLLDVNGGAYMHDMVIVSQNSTGALTGTGGYPSSGPPYTPGYDWTLTGQLTGNSVSLVITYTNSYTTTLTGTVDPSWDSMSGAGTAGVVTWVATRLP